VLDSESDRQSMPWNVALWAACGFAAIVCVLACYAGTASEAPTLALPRLGLLLAFNISLLALAWAGLALRRQAQALKRRHEAAQELLLQVEQLTLRCKTADASRQESEASLRFLMEAMQGYALVTLDSEGRVMAWNEPARALFGFSADAVVGRHYSCLFPGGDADEAHGKAQLVRAAVQGRFEERGWRSRQGGARFWAHMLVTPVRDCEGHLHRFLVLTRDITDQREADEALRRSRIQYCNLADAARDVVITVGPGSTILSLNRAFEAIPGKPRQDCVGRPFTALVTEEDLPRARDLLNELTRGTVPPLIELGLVTQAGHSVAVEFTVAPQVENGEVKGWVGIGRDITERRRTQETLRQAEAQLRQAHKMKAIGQLAGGVAHDFNNLLTVIQGFSDILLGTLPAGGKEHGLTMEIKKAGERAATLTRHLLVFSRKQILQPQVIDLNTRLVDTIKMLRRLIREDIELITELHGAPCPVKVDPGHFDQVLMNLAVNARDAMPKGGRLLFKTGKMYLGKTEAPAGADIKPGHYVLLTVSDTGCGMDQETLAHLFEPFFTTKEPGKGTGLGLATVYGSIKQSGGHIEVASVPGRGTTFKIYLPHPEGTALPQPDLKMPAPAAGGKETLLLVEDEDGVRAFAKLTLAARGYTVLEARDGMEGLTLFEQHPGRIDLVVTDVVMPRLNGTGLVQRLRELRPQLKALYISGYNDSILFRHGIAKTGCNYLHKPYGAEDLARSVREALDAAV
jgi:two-component system, cell cycle sensor histidine kinase and response regulator CckA